MHLLDLRFDVLVFLCVHLQHCLVVTKTDVQTGHSFHVWNISFLGNCKTTDPNIHKIETKTGILWSSFCMNC